MKFNQKDMLKDARKIARDNGLTLKTDNCYINKSVAYKIINRDTGLTINNWYAMTLNNAYQTLLQNY